MSRVEMRVTIKELKRKVEFRVLDLAGAEVFYPTHQFFLGPNALYVIVFNLAQPDMSRLEYWTRTMRLVARTETLLKPSVILVGTHLDEVEKREDNSELYLHQLSTSVVRKFNNIVSIKNIIFTSAKSKKGIEELRQALHERAEREPILTDLVHPAYVSVDRVISGMRADRKYMTWDDLADIARQFNLEGDAALMEMAEFLTQAGTLLWFNQPSVRDLVILDPQWLSKVMAAVVLDDSSIENGELKHEALAKIWREYPVSLHATLLSLLHHFEVAFPLRGTNKSLIPSLFGGSKPAEYAAERKKRFEANRDKNLKFQRTYKFKFLPLGFFPRVIVRALSVSNTALVSGWRYGVILRSGAQYGLLEYDVKEHLLNVMVVADSNRELLFPHLLQQIDSLIKTFYQNVKVERHVICHQVSALQPHVFRYEDVLAAFQKGEHNFFCGSVPVPMEDLAPDICLNFIPECKNVTIQQKLGAGGFGVVYKGELDGTAVAVKELLVRNERNDDAQMDKFRAFAHEVWIMSKLNHPNLVRLYGITQKPLRMVMEFCPNMDLFTFLRKEKLAISSSSSSSSSSSVASVSPSASSTSTSSTLLLLPATTAAATTTTPTTPASTAVVPAPTPTPTPGPAPAAAQTQAPTLGGIADSPDVPPDGPDGADTAQYQLDTEGHVAAAPNPAPADAVPATAVVANSAVAVRARALTPDPAPSLATSPIPIAPLSQGVGVMSAPAIGMVPPLLTQQYQLQQHHHQAVTPLSPVPIMKESLKLRIAIDIVRGMTHLHGMRPPIVHRDLRSPNIFIMSTDAESPDAVAKIGDFGLSEIASHQFNDFLSTWQWLAPETFNPGETVKYSEKCDLYSFGIILYEIYSGKDPFGEYFHDPRYVQSTERRKLSPEELGNAEAVRQWRELGWTIRSEDAMLIERTWNVHKIKEAIIREGLRPTPPNNIPAAIREVMLKCWEANPDKRPSFNQILDILLGEARRQGLKSVFGAAYGGGFGALSPTAGITVEELREDALEADPTSSQQQQSASSSSSSLLALRGPALQWRPSASPKRLRRAPIVSKRFNSKIDLDTGIMSLVAYHKLKEIWCGCRDGKIRVFNYEHRSKTVAHLLSGHTSRVSSMVHTGTHMWSASDDMRICVWDPDAHRMINILGAHKAVIRCLLYLPHRHEVWSGDVDGTICVWNARTYLLEATIRIPPSVTGPTPVLSMCLVDIASRDSVTAPPRSATTHDAAGDSTSTSSSEEQQPTSLPADVASSGGIADELQREVWVGCYSQLLVINSQDRQVSAAWEAHKGYRITSIQCIGNHVWTGADVRICLWDKRTRRQLIGPDGQPEERLVEFGVVCMIAVKRPNNKYHIWTGSSNGAIIIWSSNIAKKTKTILQVLNGHKKDSVHTLVDVGNDVVCSGSYGNPSDKNRDNSLCVWYYAST
jgi:serine/threonine protein kinase